MPGLSQNLLIGSARVDQMKREVHALIQMLFGLVKHPREHITWHEFNGDEKKFRIAFGSLERDGCLWEIWWHEESNSFNYRFDTRCLVYQEEGGERVVVCAYGESRHDLLKPEKEVVRGYLQYQPKYPHLALNGIEYAHKYLDVFAEGMLHDFPITSKVKPFLRAAELPR